MPRVTEQIEEDPFASGPQAASCDGIVIRARAAREGTIVPSIALPTSDRKSTRQAKKEAKHERRRKARQEKAAQALPLGGSGTETLQRSVADTSETLERSDANTSATLKRQRSDGSATETLSRSDAFISETLQRSDKYIG